MSFDRLCALHPTCSFLDSRLDLCQLIHWLFMKVFKYTVPWLTTQDFCLIMWDRKARLAVIEQQSLLQSSCTSVHEGKDGDWFITILIDTWPVSQYKCFTQWWQRASDPIMWTQWTNKGALFFPDFLRELLKPSVFWYLVKLLVEKPQTSNIRDNIKEKIVQIRTNILTSFCHFWSAIKMKFFQVLARC